MSTVFFGFSLECSLEILYTTVLMYKFFCRKHSFLGPEWRYCAYSRIHQMDDQPVRLKAFNEAEQGSSLSSNSNHNGGSNKQ